MSLALRFSFRIFMNYDDKENKKNVRRDIVNVAKKREENL